MSRSNEKKTKETIAERARHWIVEIDAGDLSPADEARFRQWLSKDPAHQQAFDELNHNWRRFDEVQQLRAVSADPAVVDRLVRNSRSHSAASRFAMAAILVALICGIWLVQAPSIHEMEHRTAIGEQRIIELPDESVMTLNTDTRVRVRYTDKERLIDLQQGEALFEVAQESRRPFVVGAGSGTVRAVGTAFAVHLHEHAVEVTVTEGTVEVRASAEPEDQLAPVTAPGTRAGSGRRLTERHTMRYGKDTVETVAPVSEAEIKRNLAWRRGMLDFERAPLSEVVAESNRYLRDKFVIVDPELRSLEFTGYFRAGDSNLLIKLLESNEILQTTRVDFRTVHVGRAAAIPSSPSPVQ